MIKILSYQSDEWWDTLTVTQQKEYLKLHPKSKRKVKQGGPTPAKKPATVAPAPSAKGKSEKPIPATRGKAANVEKPESIKPGEKFEYKFRGEWVPVTVTGNRDDRIFFIFTNKDGDKVNLFVDHFRVKDEDGGFVRPLKQKSKRTTDQGVDKLIFKTDIKNEIEAGQDLIQKRVPGNTKYKMKKEVTEVLTSELTGKLDLPTSADFLKQIFISSGASVGKNAPVEKQFVSMIIERWAQSSTSKVSKLVQQRVSKRFGTDPTIRGDDPDKPWKLGKSTDQAKLEKAIDTVVDHMYNKTQELLKANGVKGLYLHRGFFPQDEKTGKALETGNQTLSKRTIQLNPMSSFTSSPLIAGNFGRFIIHTYVPAERILTACITGLGCLDEAEYVVVGSTKPEQVFMSNVKSEGYKSSMPKIWDYVKQGKEIAMSKDFVIHVDEGDNADWTKKTWNLDFKYGSPEYKQWLKKNGMTDQEFRKTPAYRLGIHGKKDVEYKEEKSTIDTAYAKAMERILG